MLTKEQYQAGEQHPEGEQHPVAEGEQDPPPQFTVLSCYAFLAATVLRRQCSRVEPGICVHNVLALRCGVGHHGVRLRELYQLHGKKISKQEVI